MKHYKFVFFIFIIMISPSIIKSQNWAQWGNGSDSYIVNKFFVDTSSNTLYASGGFLSSTIDTIDGIAK
ncbi:MAG: hypothetical protein HGB12_02705, partial [Bacteroidetes bacterium]|nr:hypothetical protein [Bacteroidota bacterium]